MRPLTLTCRISDNLQWPCDLTVTCDDIRWPVSHTWQVVSDDGADRKWKNSAACFFLWFQIFTERTVSLYDSDSPRCTLHQSGTCSSDLTLKSPPVTIRALRPCCGVFRISCYWRSYGFLMVPNVTSPRSRHIMGFVTCCAVNSSKNSLSPKLQNRQRWCHRVV